MAEQKRRFEEVFARTNDIEKAHEQIAVPEVAGHPTGGAVDVMIAGLDFGTGYCEFMAGTKLYYASDEISKAAKLNRLLLRQTMLKKGFVQYMAEWWHFSYGDKEWAFMTGKDEALYNQK
jgi:D-alanyl-D-alanine dipeptidase